VSELRDNYSTQRAAKYLDVSEASVRRWSDAGLLHVKRSGRRQTRRFAEADLRAFAEKGHPRARQTKRGRPAEIVTVGNLSIPIHGHLPIFFETDEGRLRLSVPFLRDGLRAGQPCFLYAFDASRKAYLTALQRDKSIDVDAALRDGPLVLLPKINTSSRGFLGRWEQVLLEAMTRGPELIRIVGDMATVRQMLESDQDMVDFEASFNVVAKRFPLVALCQYDVRRFDGMTIFRGIKAHPDVFESDLADLLC